MTTLTATATRSADTFIGALAFGLLAPVIAGPVSALCFFADRIDGAESVLALVFVAAIVAYPIGVVPAVLVGLVAGRWRRRLHHLRFRIGLILLSGLAAALWVAALDRWWPALPPHDPAFAAWSAALGAAIACTVLVALADRDTSAPRRPMRD